MDSNTQKNADPKSEFWKPINDAANRKYRRRSPMGGSSSSSDGSPRHAELRSNMVSSRNDSLKVVDRSRKEDGDKNSKRDLVRDQSGRGGESYQYSNRHSSRSYHRDDDQGRHGKHVTDYERRYSKSSHYSGRESRESKYLRGDRDRDDRSGRNGKTYDRRAVYTKEGRGKYDDGDGYKEQESKQQKYHPDHSCDNDNAAAKKPKLFSLDSVGPGTTGASCVTDSDIDAAKIVAMRAAELVNKNLAGTGYMSADQKKKLLWGNKKKSTTEESAAHRWDATMFEDRERQEKFNKLMGVKGELKSDNPDTEKQREKLQTDLEKQYTAGLRRRDGRTVGLGL